jgi:hypothetical protein
MSSSPLKIYDNPDWRDDFPFYKILRNQRLCRLLAMYFGHNDVSLLLRVQRIDPLGTSHFVSLASTVILYCWSKARYF